MGPATGNTDNTDLSGPATGNTDNTDLSGPATGNTDNTDPSGYERLARRSILLWVPVAGFQVVPADVRRFHQRLLEGLMAPQTVCSAFALTLASVLTANAAAAQLMSTCVENSPERRGEIGCSIIESKVLPEGIKEPAFWHIDRFESLARARAAVGPASMAFDAAGASWLMTIESYTSDHHGGSHVAHVGPLPLPRATKYAMLVQSAVFTPGMYSLVHHHSGVEAVYVIDGEACYETPTRASTLRKERR